MSDIFADGYHIPSLSSISETKYWQSVYDRLSHRHNYFCDGIKTEKIEDEDIIKALTDIGWDLEYRYNSNHYYSKSFDGSLAFADIRHLPGGPRIEIGVAETNKGQYKEVFNALNKFKCDIRKPDGVYANLTWMAARGVGASHQFIRCPQWADIRYNYPSKVKAGLSDLHEMDKPWEKGKLAIWYGPPGTGKTFAIRSLMMEWSKNFESYIVTDPEKFLSTPYYYFNVIEGADRVLFILEDSADLVMRESRGNYSLSRLLNITDGLLGQSREDIFLITFNEDIESIDKAFLRPGRCLNNIEFTLFAPEEANKWLRDNNVDCNMYDEKTLAQLYNLKNFNQCFVDDEPKVGFTT